MQHHDWNELRVIPSVLARLTLVAPFHSSHVVDLVAVLLLLLLAVVVVLVVQSMEFDVTVFDTAPTGHTLRLLNMPSTLDAAMTKVMALRDKFGGLMGAATSMLGGGAAGGLDPEAVFSKLDEIKRAWRALRRAGVVQWRCCHLVARRWLVTPRDAPAAAAVGCCRPDRPGAGAPAQPRRDDLRVRVHPRVSVPLRDGAPRPGAAEVRHRHTQHRRQPGALRG